MKRVIDSIAALMLLFIFCPVIAVTALLIKVRMGSPVLFKQKRPGLYEKPFYLYKFRTMRHETDASGNLRPDAVRLTPLGKNLRKYSLDELPQLLNVLKGDMSIVGPRPLLMAYLPLYTKEQSRRHSVRPGITGLAQVNGRNDTTWDERFRLDTWYAANYNMWIDVKIVLLTVGKVLKREGITQQNAATIEKFTGTKEVL